MHGKKKAQIFEKDGKLNGSTLAEKTLHNVKKHHQEATFGCSLIYKGHRG